MPLLSCSTSRRLAHAVTTLRALLREDSGQDLIEYAYLAAFIATAGYVALNGIGPAVGATYSSWIDPTTGSPTLWEPAQPWTSSGS